MASTQQAADERPQIRQIMRDIPFAIRFIYAANPRQFVWRFCSGIAMGPIAAAHVWIMKRLGDAVIAHQFREAFYLGYIFVGLILLQVLIRYLSSVSDDRLRFSVEYATRGQALRHIASLPFETLESVEFQKLVDVFKRKSWVMMSVTYWLLNIVREGSAFIGYATVFALVPWQATAVILLAFIARLFLGRYESVWSWDLIDQETREGRRAEYYEHHIRNPNTAIQTRLLEIDRTFISRWFHVADALLQKQNAVAMKRNRAWVASDVLEAVGLGVGLYVTLRSILLGGLSPGIVIVFVTTFQMLWGSFANVSEVVRLILREGPFLVLFRRFFTLTTNPDTGADIPSQPMRIVFEDVWFRYPETDQDILCGINLVLCEGEHVALAGLNGAGKSTLLKLLMGMYEPTRGRITINGINLKDIRPSAWRHVSAVMTQGSIHFDDTIEEQLRYGDVEASIDSVRRKRAVQASALDTVVAELPHGFATHAGKVYAMPEDQAIELSGGQNQVLAVARTLYRKARIYIFDEPTSAVDPEKEEHIFSALPSVMKKKLLIYVSHRFSVLRRADRILILQDGKIVEDGSHDVLMERNGTYAELFRLQARMYHHT